ncbi:MAG TPA: hypothetical protein PLF26_07540 [Blastocatellia bacterium]|nr:hypothetical protein [Blastocatellia bacterium]
MGAESQPENAAEKPPKCIVCHSERTNDAYELGETELDCLVNERRVYRAARVHAKYGAVPICRKCFEGLGFVLDGGRHGDQPPGFVTIRKRV